MVEASAISDLLPNRGDPAKVKVVYVSRTAVTGPESLSSFRSLNIEHVSPSLLIKAEISRSTPLGAAAQRESRQGLPWSEQILLPLMRKWFWSRKPDAGFLLTEFPATLLQAKVFDEWLDSRDEALDAVLFDPSATASEVFEHYRIHGLASVMPLYPLSNDSDQK